MLTSMDRRFTPRVQGGHCRSVCRTARMSPGRTAVDLGACFPGARASPSLHSHLIIFLLLSRLLLLLLALLLPLLRLLLRHLFYLTRFWFSSLGVPFGPRGPSPNKPHTRLGSPYVLLAGQREGWWFIPCPRSSPSPPQATLSTPGATPQGVGSYPNHYNTAAPRCGFARAHRASRSR